MYINDMGNKIHRARSVIQEMHLYSDKIEALIKDSIWIISWIGGIFIVQDVTDKRTLGGAYFIFSLSLLMEFAPQIKGKSYFRSKLFHTLFCGSILSIMFMAIGLLVGIKGDKLYFNIMFALSIAAIGYIILTLFLLWLGKEDTKDTRVAESHSAISSSDLAVQKFQESLNGGKLGRIGEEVKIDE